MELRAALGTGLALLSLLLAAPCALVGGIVAWGWSADEAHPMDAGRARGIGVGALRPLVPGPGLPPGLALGAANNNLDWLRHDGRIYLGLRSAPRHWASDEAHLILLSAPAEPDLGEPPAWTLEAVFDLPDRDLREPRLLAIGERLLFYFFAADSRPGVFAPDFIHVSEHTRPGSRRSGSGVDASGRWSEARPILEPGLVVWRTKWRRGAAWMSVYDGRALYEMRGRTSTVRLLRSDDGIHWTSASGASSPVSEPGGGECAFEFDADGNLVALVRVEARGALVCTAPHDRLERWDCSPTPYRHDSPLLVRSGEEPDWPWAVGQNVETRIYGLELALP